MQKSPFLEQFFFSSLLFKASPFLPWCGKGDNCNFWGAGKTSPSISVPLFFLEEEKAASRNPFRHVSTSPNFEEKRRKMAAKEEEEEKREYVFLIFHPLHKSEARVFFENSSFFPNAGGGSSFEYRL